jgi:hypothetical protein
LAKLGCGCPLQGCETHSRKPSIFSHKSLFWVAEGDRILPAAQRGDKHRRPPFRVCFSSCYGQEAPVVCPHVSNICWVYGFVSQVLLKLTRSHEHGGRH